jgi:polyphosphate glucokinase
MEILGIDIGGTGIKGAPVDTSSGTLLAARCRLKTPSPATPAAVSETVAQVVEHFHWQGPIGCGMPAVVHHGCVMTAANIARAWIGQNAQRLFAAATGCMVTIINDADAAGYAEIHFGAGRDVQGTVLLVTLGTGIGTALFIDGHLLPNTEFGHMEVNGREGEKWAAASVREQKRLSWKKWAKRLDIYLTALQSYMWPDLIIVGGGVSKKHDKFLPLLTLDTMVVPASLRNEAGIIGAALAAYHTQVASVVPPALPAEWASIVHNGSDEGS